MAPKALFALIVLAAVAIGLMLPTPAKAPPPVAGQFASVDAPSADLAAQP
jgi:hypothetical protein